MYPKSVSTINYDHDICPRSICYASTCMPPPWAACKVLLSGMKIMHFANDASCMMIILLAANAASRMTHTPNQFFIKLPKLVQAQCASTFFELS